MIKRAARPLVALLIACQGVHAFERVECMDRPDGSVYIFKRVADRPRDLEVRIYHGWQYGRYNLPGLPIGVEEDFLNTRYDVRTPGEREAAIAAFTPLERLIFEMDVVFHHRFRDCELGAVPAAGSAYGIPTLVDDSLLRMPDIYMEGGDHEELVHLSGEAFRGIVSRSLHGRFSRPH